MHRVLNPLAQHQKFVWWFLGLTVTFGLVWLPVWFFFEPVAGYLTQFWPALAIAVGLGGILWAFASRRTRTAVEEATKIPFVRNLLNASVLTVVYGILLWLLLLLSQTLQSRFGIEPRWAWVLMTALGLPAIPAIWRLYAAAGIPGDPKVIGRGFRMIAFFALIFFGWWYHAQPNRFFDQGGRSQFWVADQEGAIYFAKGYSPVTGEELRLGTAADAKRFLKESWWQRFREDVGPAAANGPITLDGVTTYTVELHPDRWLKIKLPTWRWALINTVDPTERVPIRVRLLDGREYEKIGDELFLLKKENGELKRVAAPPVKEIPGFELHLRSGGPKVVVRISVWKKEVRGS